MKELEHVKQRIHDVIYEIDHPKTKELLSIITEGKMLRSKLILSIAPQTSHTIELCTVVEMIHTASLLHDDVIDDAYTRRGKTSINALYDNKTAIMLGDILYSKAFTKLSTMDQTIAYTISNAVKLLSIGELLDHELTTSFNTSYNLYFDMIYKKTASLIEACAKSAAILANLDENKYGLYGKNLGLAFQMIDDILDITQSSETLGKPCMLDFQEGKVTIPYLLLFERINEKEKLQSLYKKRLSPQELYWIKEKMDQTQALKDAITQAKQLGQEALKSIQKENNQNLIDIMTAMIEREY